MSETAEQTNTSLWAGLSEVSVIEVGPRHVTVGLPNGGRLDARLAVLDYRAREGDRVVIGTGLGGAWVVGVSHALRPAEEVSAAGLRAQATEDGHGVEVRDSTGDLVFRRTEDGHTVVAVPAGDLELRAPRGVVRLSGLDVELDAQQTLSLSAEDGEGSRSQVELTSRGVDVQTSELRVDAERGVARFEHAEVVSNVIDVVAQVARRRIDKIETRAKKIVERAAETYREVDDLALLRAGRVRTLVEDAYHLVSRYAKLRASEDIAIDGEKIRLG